MKRINSVNKALTVIAIVALPVATLTQEETVPQAMARGAEGRFRTSTSGSPPTVAALLGKTDIVVRGIVGEPRSYLSEDQRDVYTDYPLKNPAFLYQSQPPGFPRPGIAPTIAVTQLGGTVTINGQSFTQTEQGLPPLPPGTDGLFLLQRVGSHYMISGTFYGVFTVVDGKLKRLAKFESFAPELDGTSVVSTATELAALARTLHPAAR